MNIHYTVKESILGFKRNRTSTLITIFTVSISLLLLGVFTIITVNFTKLVDDIRSRVEIEVFLKENLTQQQHTRTGELLSAIEGVEAAKYISKDEAARIFQEEIGESFDDILDNNPLPASYRLRLSEGYKNSDAVEKIADKARGVWTVDQVVYRKQFLSLIDRRGRAFQFATLFIGIVLAISAIVLVANTIKLTIYAKRETIRTMKFVGATPMFIRMPFLLEGLFHGLIGGILASVLIALVFNFFIQPLGDDLLIHIDLSVLFYFFLMLMGGFLGLLGSVLSVGHFLRETIVTE